MIAGTITLIFVAVAVLVTGCILSKNGTKMIASADGSNWRISEGNSLLKAGKIVKLCSLVPVLFLTVAIIINGIWVIDSTEVGVVKHLGEIHGTVEEGLNFVNPLFDSVSKYDLRVHKAEAEFASYTKDAQPLTATIESQFSLQKDYAEEIARTYGSQEMMESKLANIIEERAKIVFARYSAMTLLENRSKLSAEVEAEMTNVEQMFHVNFTSVVVRDVDFSDAFENSVEQKMEAEQKALKAEQEKKEAVIRAEQSEEVAKIEARAKIAEAEGEAEALKIKKEALESMPDTYIAQLYLETWDGKLPSVMSEGSSLMLTPNID